MYEFNYVQFDELLNVRDKIVRKLLTRERDSHSLTEYSVDILSTASVIKAMNSTDYVLCYAKFGTAIVGFCLASFSCGDIQVLSLGILEPYLPDSFRNELHEATRRWFVK